MLEAPSKHVCWSASRRYINTYLSRGIFWSAAFLKNMINRLVTAQNMCHQCWSDRKFHWIIHDFMFMAFLRMKRWKALSSATGYLLPTLMWSNERLQQWEKLKHDFPDHQKTQSHFRSEDRSRKNFLGLNPKPRIWRLAAVETLTRERRDQRPETREEPGAMHLQQGGDEVEHEAGIGRSRVGDGGGSAAAGVRHGRPRACSRATLAPLPSSPGKGRCDRLSPWRCLSPSRHACVMLACLGSYSRIATSSSVGGDVGVTAFSAGV